MPDPNRFSCASSLLELSRLLGRAKRPLGLCAALALIAHLSLSGIRGLEAQQRAAKPLTTQFVKRQPRLTKPLELKKRPQPKHRRLQRKMVAVKAKMGPGERLGGFRPTQVLGKLSRPQVDIVRVARLSTAEIEPEAMAGIVEGTKEAKEKIDTQLELLDIDALDTGRYRAMVIVDPEDKRKISGFLHLALVYPPSMLTGPLKVMYTNWSPTYTGHLLKLCEAMNKYTDIQADLKGIYTFDQDEVLKVPWVMVSAYVSFEITQSEAQNIGRYLLNGGFLFADVINRGAEIGRHYTLPMDQSLRRVFKRSLSCEAVEYGRDWVFERIPNDHALYHCYFDFGEGPPMAGDTQYMGKMTFDYLEGVTIDRRMVGILSNKFFLNPWARLGMWDTRHMDPTRCLQFGVNLLVFSLTQEGSVTHQVMGIIR